MLNRCLFVVTTFPMTGSNLLILVAYPCRDSTRKARAYATREENAAKVMHVELVAHWAWYAARSLRNKDPVNENAFLKRTVNASAHQAPKHPISSLPNPWKRSIRRCWTNNSADSRSAWITPHCLLWTAEDLDLHVPRPWAHCYIKHRLRAPPRYSRLWFS